MQLQRNAKGHLWTFPELAGKSPPRLRLKLQLLDAAQFSIDGARPWRFTGGRLDLDLPSEQLRFDGAFRPKGLGPRQTQVGDASAKQLGGGRPALDVRLQLRRLSLPALGSLAQAWPARSVLERPRVPCGSTVKASNGAAKGLCSSGSCALASSAVRSSVGAAVEPAWSSSPVHGAGLIAAVMRPPKSCGAGPHGSASACSACWCARAPPACWPRANYGLIWSSNSTACGWIPAGWGWRVSP